ncbi:hypothetical protein IFM89_024639 [Coptis chinensis]|uniref:F-box domain-containing protein n=1 Tax=Coptis chinensis TaxID=261450 RepID=A0A835H5N8_9MAGN|nr:hypothetical protein IFM89_024639 [Coptis chinensis]
MVNYFSQDIIFQILLKVPAKDLVRAKVVCKLWHSIISDPNFVNSQLAHSRSRPEIILKIYSMERDNDYLEMFAITKQKHGIMQVETICNMKFPPLQVPCKKSTVKASCNGLLLISHGKHPFEVLYVYNPVTRQCVVLPSMAKQRIIVCNPPRCYNSWTLFYNDSVGKYVVFGSFHSRCVVLTVGDKEWSGYENPYPHERATSQLIYVEKKVHWLKSGTENGQAVWRNNPRKCFHVSVNIGVTMEFTLIQLSQNIHAIEMNSIPYLRRLDSYKFVGTTGDIDSSTTDYSDVVKIVMRYEDKLFYYDLKSHQYKNIAHLNNKGRLCIEINNRVSNRCQKPVHSGLDISSTKGLAITYNSFLGTNSLCSKLALGENFYLLE